jgi:diguanylate cyclase (GGDEF)-like protein/PAS domain S-box-containing protein
MMADPGAALVRLRRTLLASAVLVSGLVIVNVTITAASPLLRLLTVTALGMLALWWVLRAGRSSPAWWDIVDGAVIALAGVVLGSSLPILLLLYVRISYRSLDGPPRRLAALLAIYVGSFLGASIATGGAYRDLGLLVFVPGFFVCVVVMQTVASNLHRLQQEITLANRLRGELEESSSESFRLLFTSNPQPMWVYDRNTLGFLEVNAAAIQHYGYARAEFLDMRITDIRPPEDVPRLLEDVVEDRPKLQHSGEWRHRIKDGRIIHVKINSHQLNFGGRDAVLVLADDITERRVLDEQLRRQAFQDPLTRLANRALFRDRVDHALAHDERHADHCAVAFIDLDDFKTINDSLGHGAGDQLLVEAAARLRTAMRAEDTVARLGGDEFAILIDSVNGPAFASELAHRALQVMHQPFELEGDEWFVSASIGVAVNEGGVQAPDALMRNADLAMYAAKAAGKGRVVMFEPDMHHKVLKRIEMENDLRTALDKGQLRVHFQPEVELSSRRIVAVEALVRWQHPSRGLLLPMEFIPVAEQVGLIAEIDAFVLNESARKLRSWIDSGLTELRVCVNLSARELVDGGLVERVSRAIEDAGLKPDAIELEVTESVAVEISGALPTLAELRKIGVRIAIDDFGVGYSMLGRLQRFPIDKLKLDRSFITDVSTPEDQAPIVAGIIAMGHSLGLEVLQEGVESLEQLEFLRGLNCDQIQGYLISRPVEAERLEALLRAPVATEPVPKVTPHLRAI